MDDLIKRKAPIPSSIKVTSMVPPGMGGLGSHVQDRGYMWLPTSLEQQLSHDANLMLDVLAKDTNVFKNASATNQEKCLNELIKKANPLPSTNNPKHLIYHETAHTFEPNSLAAELRKLTPEEMKTAGEISIPAKNLSNGKEAMPEMFPKLMDGQTLTDNQMALYLKLGGIVPKF